MWLAKLCRSMCGCTFLNRPCFCASSFMRICTARCEIGPPLRPGNTGASLRGLVFVAPGVQRACAHASPPARLRCLLPLPSTVTKPLGQVQVAPAQAAQFAQAQAGGIEQLQQRAIAQSQRHVGRHFHQARGLVGIQHLRQLARRLGRAQRGGGTGGDAAMPEQPVEIAAAGGQAALQAFGRQSAAVFGGDEGAELFGCPAPTGRRCPAPTPIRPARSDRDDRHRACAPTCGARPGGGRGSLRRHDTMILARHAPRRRGIARRFLPGNVVGKVRSCESRSDPRLRGDDGKIESPCFSHRSASTPPPAPRPSCAGTACPCPG